MIVAGVLISLAMVSNMVLTPGECIIVKLPGDTGVERCKEKASITSQQTSELEQLIKNEVADKIQSIKSDVETVSSNTELEAETKDLEKQIAILENRQSEILEYIPYLQSSDYELLKEEQLETTEKLTEQAKRLVNTNQFLLEDLVDSNSRNILSQGTLQMHSGWTEPLDHIGDGSTVTYSVLEKNTLELTYDVKNALPNKSYYLSIFIFHDKDGHNCISEFGKNLVECKLKWGVWKTSFSFGPGPYSQLETDPKGNGKKTIQIHNIASGTYEMAFPLYYIIGENTPKTAYNTEERYGTGEMITFP